MMPFEEVSSTEMLLLRPLKAQTVFVFGSKAMPSGFVPAGIVVLIAKVSRSKTTIEFPAPSLI